MANVGFLDVDNTTVSNAIAGDTLFIHGSTTGGGSKKHQADVAEENEAMREAQGETDPEDYVCSSACGSRWSPRDVGTAAVNPAVSSVCDPSCVPGSEGYRFDGFMCGAGDPARFGKSCRTCYTSEAEAAKVERILRKKEVDGQIHGKHVIMCNTMRPPPAAKCDPKCAMKTDTVRSPVQAHCRDIAGPGDAVSPKSAPMYPCTHCRDARGQTHSAGSTCLEYGTARSCHNRQRAGHRAS